MRGFQLVEKLRTEASDTRSEERATLLRDAATEIERLVNEVRAYRKDYDEQAKYEASGRGQ